MTYDFLKYGLKINKISLDKIYKINSLYSNEKFFLTIHKYLRTLYHVKYSQNSISTYIPSLRRIFLYFYPNQKNIINIFGIKNHKYIVNNHDPDKISYILNCGFNTDLEEILVKLYVSLIWELYFPIQDINNIKVTNISPFTLSLHSNSLKLKDHPHLNFIANRKIAYLLNKYKNFIPISQGTYLFPYKYRNQNIRYSYKKFLNQHDIKYLPFGAIQNIRLEQFLYENQVLTIY